MGELAKKLKDSDEREKREKKNEDRPEPKPGSDQDRQALKTLQREAKKAGATLVNEGKGGLPSILVLHIFRRDEFRCHRCNKQKNLTIHHKGGVVESDWLSKKGHKNELNNFTVICDPCHDAVHDKARDEGVDSSQVLPKADKGTRRDHGQPDADEG